MLAHPAGRTRELYRQLKFARPIAEYYPTLATALPLENALAKYNFSVHERWAVFSVYGQHCYLCRCPIDFRSMEVDHILPEKLLDQRSELQEILKSFGLPSSFDLNNFGNWLPACRPCNQKKSSTRFEPIPLIQLELQRAKKLAAKAKTVAEDGVTNKKLSNAFATIERATDSEHLKPAEVAPLLASYLKTNPELKKLVNEELLTTKLVFDLGSSETIAELRISAANTAVIASTGIQIVHGRFGLGYIPPSSNPDASFYCGHCGSLGPWNGARCMSCGYLDDGD